MAAKYSAALIASWFVAWAEAEDAEVSNLKLQKLLYFAQGHHLGRYGTALFDEPVQAWSHGPVVHSVYRQLKHSVEAADHDARCRAVEAALRAGRAVHRDPAG